MRRYLAAAAVLAVLLGTAGAGIANAAPVASSVKAPSPHCTWGTRWLDCSCPRGWHLWTPPWWDIFSAPACYRTKK